MIFYYKSGDLPATVANRIKEFFLEIACASILPRDYEIIKINRTSTT